MLVDERQVTNPMARQVLEILNQGFYCLVDGTKVSIAEFQSSAEAETQLYRPEEISVLLERSSRHKFTGSIEVIDATTQAAAQRLAAEGKLVLLNFASARNPGGGFLGGAQAQEEELCRCSGLYRTLLTQPEYYETNRNDHSLLYSDHLIFSPKVPFFRLAADLPMLAQPFLASVITSPAPNAGAIKRTQSDLLPELRSTFLRRWLNLFAVAEDTGHQTLLLGAWGCGAFHNDPVMVAETAAEALRSTRFSGAFEQVVFAIPGIGKRSRENLAVFGQVLASVS